jgi:hypothetical protein
MILRVEKLALKETGHASTSGPGNSATAPMGPSSNIFFRFFWRRLHSSATILQNMACGQAAHAAVTSPLGQSVSTRLEKGRSPMVPESSLDQTQRSTVAVATTSPVDTPFSSMTTDGSEETLFDFEDSRDYDLGEGD